MSPRHEGCQTAKGAAGQKSSVKGKQCFKGTGSPIVKELSQTGL